MNIITSVSLLYLRESDAFLLLSAICERMVPEYYSRTLVGAVIDQNVFEVLVKTYLPAIHKKLERLRMDLAIISVPWFVCLYLTVLSWRTSVRLLDCFFVGKHCLIPR